MTRKIADWFMGSQPKISFGPDAAAAEEHAVSKADGHPARIESFPGGRPGLLRVQGASAACFLLAGHSVGNLGMQLFSPACGAAGTANTPAPHRPYVCSARAEA